MRRFDNYSSQRVNHFAESLLELAGLLERKALDRSAAASVNVFITGDDARCRRIKRFGREQRVEEPFSLSLSSSLFISFSAAVRNSRPVEENGSRGKKRAWKSGLEKEREISSRQIVHSACMEMFGRVLKRYSMGRRWGAHSSRKSRRIASRAVEER